MGYTRSSKSGGGSRKRTASGRRTIGGRAGQDTRSKTGQSTRSSKASVSRVRRQDPGKLPGQKVGGRKGSAGTRGGEAQRRKRWWFWCLLILSVASPACVRTVYLPQEAAYYREKWEEAVKRQIECEKELQECAEKGERTSLARCR